MRLTLVSLLVGLLLFGGAGPAAAKVAVEVQAEPSTHVEVGEPFTLRLVPFDCEGCLTAGDIARVATFRVENEDGVVVWRGEVSSQLTLDGIVLVDDHVRFGSTTWLNVMVPVESVMALIPEEEAGLLQADVYVIGRIAMRASPVGSDLTAVIVAGGVMLAVVAAFLLVGRSRRSRPSSGDPSQELARSSRS